MVKLKYNNLSEVKKMTIEYQEAFAEVDYILGITSEELLKKIPKSLLDFIKKNKKKDYKFYINKELSLANQSLKKETKAIISLIYRNYFCSPEQSKKYKLNDLIELEEEKKRLKEKYDPNNLFKKD